MDRVYFVYIATNKRNTVLYTGVTRDIYVRMSQHKSKLVKGFTSKYNVDKLVFVENFGTPMGAISAEKRIKGWTRKKKIDLIEKQNPKWNDLFLLERDSSTSSE